jgi:Skp family chaperone for outer membrane proteins
VRRLAALLILVAVATSGCGPQVGGQAPAPAADPSPGAPPAAGEYRVGVVNFDAMVRAHRRWPELDAVNRRMERLQVRLGSPPPPPDLPTAPPTADLQAEADRLRESLHGELRELQEQLQRRLEAFANDLRADHEARLADRHRELNTELQRVITAKRDDLQRDLERFELSVMTEYRLPLANLRVRADVVGIPNEEEAQRVSAEAERITKERDEKIRARAQELERQLQVFQEARTAEAEETIKAMVAALEEEGKKHIEAKRAEIEAEFNAAVKRREGTLRTAMEARQQIVVQGAEGQLRAAQQRYVQQVEAEARRLRAELQELAGQRLRLEDAILAEVKIEVATVAQARGVDAVVTHTIAHPGIVDLTQDVIARLKRP